MAYVFYRCLFQDNDDSPAIETPKAGTTTTPPPTQTIDRLKSSTERQKESSDGISRILSKQYAKNLLRHLEGRVGYSC